MALSDEIDVTIPANGEKASKSEIRSNWAAIKTALAFLEARIALPGREAFDDRVSREEVEAMVRKLNERNDRLAYQIATGVVDL